ncbi:ABC transporter ATP-binding protein [Klebsiella pneumoniae subsp. pneumoniae]|nr:ABC transporter ATP-binding protein [Klebsiella pneumoniae subsp. pneumoniae]
MRAMAGLGPCRGELLLEGENLLTQPFSRRAEQVVYLPQTLPRRRASACAGVDYRCPARRRRTPQSAAPGGSDGAAATAGDCPSGDELPRSALRRAKQLVGLAQSLIRQPRLLLLDEPLSALDLNYQFHVMDLVRRETRRRNIVTLVVVHDINIALRHADHVLMLKAGQLLGDGTPAAVITPETLAAVYGVRGRIEPCSQGVRQVIIDGLVDSEA